MAYTPATEATAIRQTCTAAFNGSPCTKASKVFEQFVNPTTLVIEYVDPDDLNVNDADAGGEFIFSESVVIKEIRGACGNISIAICDLDDSHSIAIPTDPSPITAQAFMSNLVVQKSQKVKITSTTAGWVEIYVSNSIYN